MANKKEMEVVKGLDLKRYMGKWYEIASLPSRFQPKNSSNTTATYTLKDDGATVEVLNETWIDGGKKKATIQGTAYKADPSSDEAKFKVRFMVPPFLPIIPVTGNYWVLEIGDDYEYVLIGEPSRSSLWILCRKTQLDDSIYDELVEKAIAAGYDVKKLHRTTQTDPHPSGEGEQGPKKDTTGFWWIKSIFGK